MGNASVESSHLWETARPDPVCLPPSDRQDSESRFGPRIHIPTSSELFPDGGLVDF